MKVRNSTTYLLKRLKVLKIIPKNIKIALEGDYCYFSPLPHHSQSCILSSGTDFFSGNVSTGFGQPSLVSYYVVLPLSRIVLLVTFIQLQQLGVQMSDLFLDELDRKAEGILKEVTWSMDVPRLHMSS